MFPRLMMLCVADEEEFHRYKSSLSWLVRRLEARLVLFHSGPVPTSSIGTGAFWPPEIERKDLSHLARDEALEGLVDDSLEIVSSDTLPETIFATAKRMGADLLVLPTHGRSRLDRLITGSVTEQVIRRCAFPVLTIDIPTAPLAIEAVDCERVIAPTDLSDGSRRAAGVAAALADRLGCGLTLFHAVDSHPYAHAFGGRFASVDYSQDVADALRPQMEELAKELSRLTKDVDIRIENGAAPAAIAACGDEFRNPLVVMATSGRDSLGGLILGSATERLLRTATHNVLALPESFLSGNRKA
ncbi:MAG: universal stress protein [Planctomycetes bacterium]|nr:universal stress protein [Planctomycetota bacterium]